MYFVSRRTANRSLNFVSQDMSDVCVGTSVGTITEPECLGPCEPGTSVTLEGIVWHETEGGKELLYSLIRPFVLYVLCTLEIFDLLVLSLALNHAELAK